MGIFDNMGGGSLSNIADTVGRDPDSVSEGAAFGRDFNAEDFDSFGTTIQTGRFEELATFKVPASTEYSWGYGRASAPENQGYIYVELETESNTEVSGTLRLKQESATGRQTRVVADMNLDKLDASKSNRTNQVPLPEQVEFPKVTQDSYLVVEVKATNADGEVIDLDSDAEGLVDVILPVTEYDLSQ